jgi:hypothetical protein
MPTSTYAHISTVIKYLQDVRPASILDIGLGNGKMGFIARDLLDVMLGERARREDWRVRIDGIEVFADYIQAHQRAIYDDIHIGDAFDVIDRLGDYEMIIIGDVLEHFDRDRAEAFLDKAARHATKAILLSIPLGEAWTQDDIYGNDYERHRSFWKVEDLQCYASQAQGYVFEGLGLYGSFLIEPETYRSVRSAKACEQAQSRFPADPESAIEELTRRLDALGPELGGELQLAELLVRHGAFTTAAVRLERARASFPRVESFQTYIDQLYAMNAKAA